MKSIIFGSLLRPMPFFIFLNIFSNYGTNLLNSEEQYFKEMSIDSSTKIDNNNSDLPTNPFEIVEMIRRSNSLNDATKPSDAIDDALKSFNMIGDEEKI